MENWKCSCGQINSGSICTRCQKSFQGTVGIRRYTKACLDCGIALEDGLKYCNKCGGFLETVKCPNCGKATNALEAKCNNCDSNIVELVRADLKKSSALLQLLQETESFKGIQPDDQLLRLARQHSITGLAAVFAFESAAKREGTYNDRFVKFVYNEASPDEWDNPGSYFNPHDKYSSKQEFIESIREKSIRPDMGFFAWITLYAKTGKDIFAYQLCILLSNLYTLLGECFDHGGFIISKSGVELQQQAYDLMCAAQHNNRTGYSTDDIAKRLYSKVRYSVARQYFTIGFESLDEPDENGKHTILSIYFSNFKDGYKRAFDILKNPLAEETTHTKLLRGLLNYNYGNNQKFIEAWNAACRDSKYVKSEKDFTDDCIFTISAFCMTEIYRNAGDMVAALSTLRLAGTNVTKKHWAERIAEEISKYQRDSYGNIVYVK